LIRIRIRTVCREWRRLATQSSTGSCGVDSGVREDPATGFGAGLLGAYLLEYRLFSDPMLSLRIEQGHEVRRPSVVMLRARRAHGSYEVTVGGQVISVVQGELVSER
jgi:predicted PhzF superfamily epimerase YddE/YHI9